MAALGRDREAAGVSERQEVADEGQIHGIDDDNEVERNNRFFL